MYFFFSNRLTSTDKYQIENTKHVKSTSQVVKTPSWPRVTNMTRFSRFNLSPWNHHLQEEPNSTTGSIHQFQQTHGDRSKKRYPRTHEPLILTLLTPPPAFPFPKTGSKECMYDAGGRETNSSTKGKDVPYPPSIHHRRRDSRAYSLNE